MATMKIAEFNKQSKACQKIMVIRMFLSIGFMFATMGVAALIQEFLGGGPSFLVFGPIAVLIGMSVMLFGFHLTDQTFRCYPMLTCPHCEGNLLRSKSVVVATGNCPGCGRKVLKDKTIGT